METKFTKGKWFNLYNKVYIETNLLESGKAQIVECLNFNTKANALLISKAPEMFEMLRIISEREVFEGKIKFDIHLQDLVKQLLKEATEL